MRSAAEEPTPSYRSSEGRSEDTPGVAWLGAGWGRFLQGLQTEWLPWDPKGKGWKGPWVEDGPLLGEEREGRLPARTHTRARTHVAEAQSGSIQHGPSALDLGQHWAERAG